MYFVKNLVIPNADQAEENKKIDKQRYLFTKTPVIFATHHGSKIET